MTTIKTVSRQRRIQDQVAAADKPKEKANVAMQAGAREYPSPPFPSSIRASLDRKRPSILLCSMVLLITGAPVSSKTRSLSLREAIRGVVNEATVPSSHGSNWAKYLNLTMNGTIGTGLEPTPYTLHSTKTRIEAGDRQREMTKRPEKSVDGEFEEDQSFSVKTGRSMDEISDGKTAAEKNKPTRRSGDGLGALIRRYPEVHLATLVDAPPDGAHWLHEIKLDGYRLLGFILGGVSRLRTRKGKDWTDHFPSLSAALKN